MKYLSSTFLVLLCSILILSGLNSQLALSVHAYEDEGDYISDQLELDAQTAVLMDAETGQILYNKDMGRRMHPASITKILTGLIVVENTQPVEMLTVSDTAVDLPLDSSTIWLREGEKITVDDAMYALMVASANDAANLLAEHVAGSQQAFADLMNERCKEIGALNTHFDNPHGLTSDTHYTTAQDMALITQEAMKNEDFMKYFGVPLHIIPETNLQETKRYLYNHNYMIRQSMWAFTPEVICGKTGYTESAGSTLCTVAEDKGRSLITVVLKSTGNGKFTDTQKLIEYGFENFRPATLRVEQSLPGLIPVLDNDLNNVGEASIQVPETVDILLNEDADLKDFQAKVVCPDYLEQECSNSSAYINVYNSDSTQPILRVPLEQDFTFYPLITNLEPETIPQEIKAKPSLSAHQIKVIVIAALIAAPILLIVFVVVNKYREKRKRQLAFKLKYLNLK